MEKQPPIFLSCISLAKLVNAVTRHWPRGYKNTEGEDMRRASVQLVNCCLQANRSERGSQERRFYQNSMADNLGQIEAYIAIVNDNKVCFKTKTGQKWDRLISAKTEVKLQGAIQSVSKQLYGWRRAI